MAVFRILLHSEVHGCMIQTRLLIRCCLGRQLGIYKFARREGSHAERYDGESNGSS